MGFSLDFSVPGMDSDEWSDASVAVTPLSRLLLLCDSLPMPLLPDVWDTALGCILDLLTLGCQIPVYIWLLLLAFGGHVLVGYGFCSWHCCVW